MLTRVVAAQPVGLQIPDRLVAPALVRAVIPARKSVDLPHGVELWIDHKDHAMRREA